MPDWERRTYIRCAMEDDRIRREEIRELLEFGVKVICGVPDEPTKDNPVISSQIRTERSDKKIKRVLDFEYDDKVKKLAEESMSLKAEGEALLKQVLAQAQAAQAKAKVDGTANG